MFGQALGGDDISSSSTSKAAVISNDSITNTLPTPVPSRKRKTVPSEPRNARACVPCRIRKCKCKGTPPDSCPNCVKDEYPCKWPVEDGRSSLARKRRSRSKKVLALVGEAEGEDGIDEEEGVEQEEIVQDRSPSKSIQERKGTVIQSKAMGSAGVEEKAADDSWYTNHDWLHAMEMGDTDLSAVFDTQFVPSDSHQAPEQPHSRDLDSIPNPTVPTSTSTMDPFDMFFPQLDQWPSAFESPSFINAISARLPTVEEGSLGGEGITPTFFDFLNETGTNGVGQINTGHEALLQPCEDSNLSSKGKEKESKIVKVTWWRPHGPTAIAPGLKRLSLKVRVEAPTSHSFPTPTSLFPFDNPSPIHDHHGMPSKSLMRHLIDLFIQHFGCQFPSLERETLENDLEGGTGSVFLFNCIAATAARFSIHPSITSQGPDPHEYGNVYHKAAKDLLGSMLGVPSRKTVMALVLLAHLGFAVDSESEEWMMTGMAVRMAMDLGLHLNPTSDIPPEEQRLSRLTFWSTFLLDLALSFGTGRETTIRLSSIKQPFPTEEDIHPTPSSTRSPFPYAVKQMMAYGPLVNSLNGDGDEGRSEDVVEKERALWFGEAVAGYNALPGDMQWNVTNLQSHSRTQQAPIYLHLHLWMHTIIASRYLTNTDYLRRSNPTTSIAPTRPGSGMATPNVQAATNLWRNSARTIGDILVLSDVVNPWSYLALPFVNQAFFVAGCCFVKEVEQQQQKKSQSSRSIQVESSKATTDQQAELLRTLLLSVASSNITTLQQGLTKQTTYWSGVAWVAEALKQRLEGTSAGDIDLSGGLEKLGSWVGIGDRGVVDHEQARSKGIQ